MNKSPDSLVLNDNWSDLRQFRELPNIDHERLNKYRIKRLRAEIKRANVGALVIVNPISLRYAVNYNTYPLFQARVPSTYLIISEEGPTIIHRAYTDYTTHIDRSCPGRLLNFFDAGDTLNDNAQLFAKDLVEYLEEIGTDNRRVAIESVNPSVTSACLQKGLEVLDGMALTEKARIIKSQDEIECIRWSIAVAELGIAKMEEALKPGVTELQLWGLLNYTNLSNQGGWHEGQMLASGPRINPWLQEASQRPIESGDLVGFDTDMVGPMGYFCDISRTFHCGPKEPTKRQKEIYQLAYDEVQYNLQLIKPGKTIRDIQEASYTIPTEFQEQAYPCIIHGVGMCDEYPRINPKHLGENPYNGTIEEGMVLAVESYMGAVGERDGVKLEEQILVTNDGYEMLSTYPIGI